MLPWDAFLRRYRPLARAIAERLAGPAAEAEDIVQEAALALLAALRADRDRFASTEHARNYFLRTVQNLAGRARERRQPLASLDADPPDREGPEAAAAQLEERRAALRAALSTLPAEERDLVTRRFLRHETLKRISADTGVPISTLHNRERAILARLQRALVRDESGARTPSEADRD